MLRRLLIMTIWVSCFGFSSATNAEGSDLNRLYPDVVAVEVTERKGLFTFSVTLSSPYDTPERYADAFRILDENGNELGIRVLLHDHANEQPFTRSLTRVIVPEGVNSVIVQGRDLVNGWGGVTQTVLLKP